MSDTAMTDKLVAAGHAAMAEHGDGARLAADFAIALLRLGRTYDHRIPQVAMFLIEEEIAAKMERP